METIPHLDLKVKEFHGNLNQQKIEKNKYLLELKEVLDLYLLSVMEEEDVLYKVLHIQADNICNNYNDLKTISPFTIQLNILMSLPCQHSDIQVESGEVGFVKLKFPSNVKDRLESSKMWRDACNCGIQNSLLRHVDLWKDQKNYFKSTVFLKWFIGVVDKSLEVTGQIPNYKIVRLKNNSNVTLRILDTHNNVDMCVTLRPVFSFPISKLPQDLLCHMPQDTTCNEWTVECSSNEASDPQLWSTSLWQHEKLVIKTYNLKPFIHILKGVRDTECQKTTDFCEWNMLTNNHIRNLVMVLHKRNQIDFQNVCRGKLLIDLLLQLRNNLVSREGLPYFWDETRNLLCGLTGSQKSSLARLVTRTIKDLQDPKCQKIFRLETYGATQNILKKIPPESSFESTSERNDNIPFESTSERNEAIPKHVPFPSVHDYKHQSFVGPIDGSNQSVRLNSIENKTNSAWWIVGGIATVAIAALTGAALIPKRKKNNQPPPT